MSVLSELTPKSLLSVMDLVKEAGIDVSDWQNYKGGANQASRNPKYCYEWSFVNPGHFIIVNIWLHQMNEEDGQIFRELNINTFAHKSKQIQKIRAQKMFGALREAYRNKLPVRVIVCDGKGRDENDPNSKSSVNKRMLDPEYWTVTVFDENSGAVRLERGAMPTVASDNNKSIDFEGWEGEPKIRWFLHHRHREKKLRKLKINEAMKLNNGRLICEVPGCGFEFYNKYGKIGAGYAHVHHKEQLCDAPEEGRKVTLKDLAVVCANCHAMIHVGGECRSMDSLIPLLHPNRCELVGNTAHRCRQISQDERTTSTVPAV